MWPVRALMATSFRFAQLYYVNYHGHQTAPPDDNASSTRFGDDWRQAMKRHPALQQLSRDHQDALAVALELTRATEATARDARARFLDYWRAEGREHFRQEEQVLLPAFARVGDPDDPIIARV